MFQVSEISWCSTCLSAGAGGIIFLVVLLENLLYHVCFFLVFYTQDLRFYFTSNSNLALNPSLTFTTLYLQAGFFFSVLFFIHFSFPLAEALHQLPPVCLAKWKGNEQFCEAAGKTATWNRIYVMPPGTKLLFIIFWKQFISWRKHEWSLLTSGELRSLVLVHIHTSTHFSPQWGVKRFCTYALTCKVEKEGGGRFSCSGGCKETD